MGGKGVKTLPYRTCHRQSFRRRRCFVSLTPCLPALSVSLWHPHISYVLVARFLLFECSIGHTAQQRSWRRRREKDRETTAKVGPPHPPFGASMLSAFFFFSWVVLSYTLLTLSVSKVCETWSLAFWKRGKLLLLRRFRNYREPLQKKSGGI